MIKLPEFSAVTFCEGFMGLNDFSRYLQPE